MSTLYVDAVGGLAGDMFVAALLDAGAPIAAVRAAVDALGLVEVGLETERVWRGPFSALRFIVHLPASESTVATGGPEVGGASANPVTDGAESGDQHSRQHGHGHSHAHGHDHAGGSTVVGSLAASSPAAAPASSRAPASSPAPASPQPGTLADVWRIRSRRWSDIDGLISAAPLAPRVAARTRATFHRLAVAEGRVHGIDPAEVTFHEVGAVDSIVDIVGACAALESLGVERIVVSVLPMGTGHVLGDHGWIPLPAPATVELLRGIPIEGREIKGETVTPTGAALVAALMEPGSLPAMRLTACGVGAGTWDPASHPNVVRVMLGTENSGATTQIDEVQAQVDTLSGELVPPLIEALLAAGAVDAFVTPILMKKGRPGWLVTALVPPALREPVADVLLKDGHTLGVRWSRRDRVVLDREHIEVVTPFGAVRVKVGRSAGVIVHAEPEFEDCRRVAASAKRSVVEVHSAALAAWAAVIGIT